MLDTALLAKVVLVGTLTAAAVMWLAARWAPSAWQCVCWSWAVGVGVLAASGASDQWPRWPPLEDRARFLTLLVPSILVVETLVATLPSRGAACLVRLGLAAVVAPVLLHNTVYLTNQNGRNSAEWSPLQASVVLSGLAAVLALIWAMLARLQTRTPTPAVFWVLMLDAWAAAVTVMLSGYYYAGILGLGLAAALAGASLAWYITQPQSPTNGSLGMSVIGIFAVVLMGRFFGSLSNGLAACLLLAPLLAWTVELPWMRALASRSRGMWRLACVAAPLIVVVIIAQRKFSSASKAGSRTFEPNAISELIEK